VKALVIGVAFAGYHLYAGVDRRLGADILGRTIWRGTARSGRERDA
jgi:hypothetical protein